MLKTKRKILLWHNVYKQQYFLKISRSLSHSIRGHPCSNRQFSFPFTSQRFIGFKLTFRFNTSLSFLTKREVAGKTKLEPGLNLHNELNV